MGSPEGVADARRAAELARVLALRDPMGADWLGRARVWLEEASRRRSVADSCAAALDLARLEARDARDLEQSYRVAFRASLRFGDDPCVVEVRRLMSTLEAWRPGIAELAEIEADPDQGDPSAARSGVRGPSSLAGAPSASASMEWAAARAEPGGAGTLTGIAVYGQDGSLPTTVTAVRVVLRFDRVVAFREGAAPAQGSVPNRVRIDLPSVRAAGEVSDVLAVGAGGLTDVRVSAAPSGLRVVLSLESGAVHRSFVLPDPFRVVLDVERGQTGAAGTGVRTIVLDPGHGGDDFGARFAGLEEADLALDLAVRVRSLLRARLPEARVVLTRDRDVFLSLEQRTAMANAIGADLFLSIHLNAAREPVRHGGVTTFVLDTSNDAQALRLAARENGTSVAEVGDLSRILASLHREEQLAASRSLAGWVHRGTLQGGRRVLPTLHDRGVRSAMFYVLVGARMPAVLLEASFLTRPEEADALARADYRQSLAEGIAGGLVAWASSRR